MINKLIEYEQEIIRLNDALLNVKYTLQDISNFPSQDITAMQISQISDNGINYINDILNIKKA